jgi:penicillin-binding protein 1A
VSPHLIELVENRDGAAVYRADRRTCSACDSVFTGDDGPDIQQAGDQLIDPITAYQIDTMLEGVVIRGTGAAAAVLGRPVGGKTGTTNDFRSAWFVGFSPQIVVAVYIGYDDNRSLGKGETGAVAALPVFIEFMQEAIKGLPPLEFKAPPNTKFAQIGPNREGFRPGTEPQPKLVPTVIDSGGPTSPFLVTPNEPGPEPPGNKMPPAPPKALRPPETPGELNGLY